MASAEVEERWQAKRSTVAERNKYLLNNSLMSDVKFSFPSRSRRSIPAHKHVLAISSPVFFAMFYGDLADGRDTIEITDCDPDTFLHFLRFIYSDEAPNFEDMNCAISVWFLADKYDVPALAKECANFIDGNIDPMKALEILPYARQSHDEHLEKICWAVIDHRTEKVVANELFLEITHDLLFAFLERTALRIREIELFKAANSWAERRCEEAGETASGENKRAMLGEDLLMQIRFSLMSPGEFSYTVLPTEILFSGEVIDVFRKLNSVHPGDFKFLVSPRRKTDNSTFDSFRIGWIDVIQRNETYRSRKSGLLTFTLNQLEMPYGVMLHGVRIVVVQEAQHGKNVPITLTISEKGMKTLRQIKGQFAFEKQRTFSSMKKFPSQSRCYGHVDVIFNRPLYLKTNVCHTIETETDSTDDTECFVWPNESPSKTKTTTSSGKGIVRDTSQLRYIFGYCGDYCCLGGHCGGEILELFLRSPSKYDDVC